MKRLPLLLSIISLLESCQSNDYGSYHISLIGWTFMGALGLIMFLILVLKKGVVKEGGHVNKSSVPGITLIDFEPMGNYLGGHPASDNVIASTVFRKNSDCCLFFYKDGSYSLPEYKFKIKIRSFKNIFVDDLSSFEKKLISGAITLTKEASNLIKKKNDGQLAFITINWTDGQSDNSTVFSFEGKDAMQRANTAKDSFLQTLN